MSDDMTFREAIGLARAIYRRFEKVERRPWGVEGAMIELVKQVGELAKYVMVAEKYYLAQRDQMPQYQVDPQKVGDELADILYAVFRIADYYGIDLVAAHIQARKSEAAWLTQLGA